MPLSQPFYINGPSLASATAVFLDAAMTLCADDGFYSDGSIVREQVGCVLLPENTCPNCCNSLCSGWTIVSGAISATISYIECGSNIERNENMDYPATLQVCAAVGTTPFWQYGAGDITRTQICGCCTTACETWTVNPTNPLGGSVDVAWIDCTEGFMSQTFYGPDAICIVQGTAPTIEGGSGSIAFEGCGCKR